MAETMLDGLNLVGEGLTAAETMFETPDLSIAVKENCAPKLGGEGPDRG